MKNKKLSKKTKTRNCHFKNNFNLKNTIRSSNELANCLLLTNNTCLYIHILWTAVKLFDFVDTICGLVLTSNL